MTIGGLVMATDKCRTPKDGFYTALRWAMHLDRQSVEVQERAARVPVHANRPSKKAKKRRWIM